MYYRYFGLTEQPFSIAVDPRYLFMSARHRDALAHLLYGVGAGGGFILLTGPVGTGKTTITRSLLEQLPKNTDLALVLNPSLNGLELLASICDELKIAYNKESPSLKHLNDVIYHYLLENFSKGRNTVLLIDEAQHLHFDTLEQIRLLTNLETNTKKLLQIILVGQPELKTLLQKPELSQLAQRITARYQLTALDFEETKAYISHRLHIAGMPAQQQPFSEHIIKRIYKISKGTPRLINVLCDRMLLGCYGQNKSYIDTAIAKLAIAEINDEEKYFHRQKFFPPVPSLKTISATIIIVTLLFWLVKPSSTENHSPPQQIAVANNQENDTEPQLEDMYTFDFAYDNQQLALSALGEYLEFSENEVSCNKNLRCDFLTANNWQDLADYQYPVTLKLIDLQQRTKFANLISIKQSQAELLIDKQLKLIPLMQLLALWQGEFILIWQAPEHYSTPVRLGDQDPLVAWLALHFSILDQQQQQLADDVFNQALYQRVLIFQRENNLVADGVVGLKTLLKLQQQLAGYTIEKGSI